jgi:RNAse (barnase) inhibitor barstar
VSVHEPPEYRIDGAAFSDLDGFYDEIETKLPGAGELEHSLDALDELLSSTPAPLPRRFRIIWEHSDLSRRLLGSVGDGSFTDLIARIARHPNVELILS